MADVCVFYMVEFLVLFIAIMLIASAVQRYGLHRRIALRALLLAGSDPKRLLLSMMIVTGFLSLWILNLALVSMMLPIVVALVDQLSTHETRVSVGVKHYDEDEAPNGEEIQLEGRELRRVEMDDTVNKSTEVLSEKSQSEEGNRNNYNKNLVTCFNLWLVYSTTIGGAGSLIGTINQVIMNANLEIKEVNENKGDDIIRVLREEYESMGPITGGGFSSGVGSSGGSGVGSGGVDGDGSAADGGGSAAGGGGGSAAGGVSVDKVLVLVVLIVVVVMMYVESSTITAGVALICFILPRKKPKFNIHDDKPYVGLLEWKSADAMVPWGILIYAGGLLSTAEATKESGLADLIGDQFEFIASLPYWLALEQDIHPHYFILSLTLATNLAFCLPAGSVVNALIISYGSVTTFQMIKTGLVMNIICLVVLNIGVNTYGWWFLNFDDVPAWALSSNITVTSLG
ncbi:Na(+)/citrate cotransporter-like [Ptychodera flava]|uniref:Na(+)/citrate cotransporter-like n=1 Tax=Ptychodera flava TaxID=63121 RepID=UPI00396A7FB6